MKGCTTRTPERVAEAQRLRASGWRYRELAEHFGIAVQTVHQWVNDPDGSLLADRKRRYDKTCVDCGGRVDGTSVKGRSAEPRCVTCTTQRLHDERYWTPERIVEAIQRAVDEDGRVPSGGDWGHMATKPEWAPYLSIVTREFGTWNAAVAAAGFSTRSIGHYGRAGEDPDLCREIAARYDAGEGTSALAREYGCGTKAIIYRARRGGATIRPPHQNAPLTLRARAVAA